MTHTATLLDGKVTSQKVLAQVKAEVERIQHTQKPKLVAVLVGENPASEIYVARKMKIAGEVGIESELHRFPATCSQTELLDHLAGLNADPAVHAILVQLPLPKHIDEHQVLLAVNPGKDVDGFHPYNMGQLLLGMSPPALPCTPAGIMALLDAYNLALSGSRAVVVGRSNIVGKPITLLLTQRDATVTLCHSRTRDLDGILREADVVVAAAGKAGLVKAENIKPGAIIIDVGINRLENGKIVGDVDFEAARHHAGYITPVPGGVGPMTIAMLMRNTVCLYNVQHGQPVPRALAV